jgi:plastocyanin
MIGYSTGRSARLRIVGVALATLLAFGGALFLARSGRSGPPPVGLIAREFLFDPNGVSVGTGEIAFVVKNQGAIEHNLALEVPGGKTQTLIAIIEPGQIGKATVSLRAGLYTIYCSLPGHRDAGMAATLRVSP